MEVKKPDEDILRHISIMYVYHPETGEIDGPRNNDIGYWTTSNGRTIRKIEIKGRRYRRYHLGWFLYYGEWPKSQLDHKDRDSTNDKIENLQEVNNFEQQQNKDNYNGYRGFSIEKKNDGKWRFKNWRVYNKAKDIYLGNCINYEEGMKIVDQYYCEIGG